MGENQSKIQAIINGFRDRDRDALYLGFFECFNQGYYFEAHEVLEELWLPQRHQPIGDYYRGLIQLAGAFVHLKKERLRPAASLLKLARSNLGKFPGLQDGLDVDEVLRLIQVWQTRLEAGCYLVNPLTPRTAPILQMPPSAPRHGPGEPNPDPLDPR